MVVVMARAEKGAAWVAAKEEALAGMVAPAVAVVGLAVGMVKEEVAAVKAARTCRRNLYNHRHRLRRVPSSYIRRNSSGRKFGLYMSVGMRRR